MPAFAQNLGDLAFKGAAGAFVGLGQPPGLARLRERGLRVDVPARVQAQDLFNPVDSDVF